jgi:hypothetical protein
MGNLEVERFLYRICIRKIWRKNVKIYGYWITQVSLYCLSAFSIGCVCAQMRHSLSARDWHSRGTKQWQCGSVCRLETISPKTTKTLLDATDCSTIGDVVNREVPEEYAGRQIVRIYGKPTASAWTIGDETHLTSASGMFGRAFQLQ